MVLPLSAVRAVVCWSGRVVHVAHHLRRTHRYRIPAVVLGLEQQSPPDGSELGGRQVTPSERWSGGGRAVQPSRREGANPLQRDERDDIGPVWRAPTTVGDIDWNGLATETLHGVGARWKALRQISGP